MLEVLGLLELVGLGIGDEVGLRRLVVLAIWRARDSGIPEAEKRAWLPMIEAHRAAKAVSTGFPPSA